MQAIKIRALNDRTTGFRFQVLGNKGLYRKRKNLRRYGVDMLKGDTFMQIHLGKRSIYIEQVTPLRKLFKFAG